MGEDRATILIVDDEPNIRDIVQKTLTNKYNVLVAGNAEDAIPHLHSAKLVISDVTQPGSKGGYWLLQQVREQYGQLPFILMSGYFDPKQAQIAQLANARLTKPLDLDTLDRTVDVMLAEHLKSKGKQ